MLPCSHCPSLQHDGDLQVACFKHIPASSTSPDRWVYADTRRPHTHDVRAMLTVTPPGAEPLLLTGGNDAQLFAFSVPHFQTVHFHPVCYCVVTVLACFMHAILSGKVKTSSCSTESVHAIGLPFNARGLIVMLDWHQIHLVCSIKLCAQSEAIIHCLMRLPCTNQCRSQCRN